MLLTLLRLEIIQYTVSILNNIIVIQIELLQFDFRCVFIIHFHFKSYELLEMATSLDQFIVVNRSIGHV